MESSGLPESSGFDFLVEYRAISNKLKKRFLRRPNVNEANDLFAKLGRRLRDDEEPQYEALCHVAVARCENSIGNHAAEAESLIAASRSFFEAEMKIQRLGCPSFEEHLLSAINSYNQAIRILKEGKQLSRAASLCHEAGEALRSLERHGEALSFFQSAADLRSNTILEYCQSKEEVASCFIATGDYHNALSVLAEVASMAEQYGGKPLLSVYADIMKRCEVRQILLLLIIEPSNQNLSPALVNVLDKYTWESEDDSTSLSITTQFMSEELFLLLQSLVMAVQIQDKDSILLLEDNLAPLLDTEPRTLLRKLVRDVQLK